MAKKCCCCPTRPRVSSTTWTVQVHSLTDGQLLWFDNPGFMHNALFSDENVFLNSDSGDYTLGIRDSPSGLGRNEHSYYYDGSQSNQLVTTSDGVRYSYETSGGDHKVDAMNSDGVVQWTYDTGADGLFNLLSFGNTSMLQTSAGFEQIDDSGSLVRTWTNCTPQIMLADNKVIHERSVNVQQLFTDDSVTWSLNIGNENMAGLNNEYTIVSGGYRIVNSAGTCYILDDGTFVWKRNSSSVLGVSGTSKTFIRFGNHIIRYDENDIDWFALDVFDGDYRGPFKALDDGGFLILCEAGLQRIDNAGAVSWLNGSPHFNYSDNYVLISDVDYANDLFVIIGQLQP